MNIKICIGISVLIIGTAIYSCQRELSCEGCVGNNKPPIANAGADMIINSPIDSALLDGSGSTDTDGRIEGWEWKKISGPTSFLIRKPNEEKTIVSTLTTGQYAFELTVKDNDGLFAKDTVLVFVNDTSANNKPPVANAGPDQTIVLPTNSANLDGNASSDPDNNIVSYSWRVISGPGSPVISNVNTAQTQVNNLIEGYYWFELKVTDAGGLFDYDTIQVAVTAVTVCYNTANNCNDHWICLPDTSFQEVISIAPINYSFTGTFGAAASNGNKMYFAGGHDGGYFGNVFSIINIYDVTTQTWLTDNLSIPRSHLSGTSCGSKVLFAGGNNFYSVYSPPPYGINLEYYRRVDIYDANDYTYTPGNLSEGRSNMAAIGSADKAYFIGGKTLTGYSSKMDVYNSTNNTWSVIQLPRERADAGAVIFQNKLFIAGGHNNNGNLTIIDIYDLGTLTWSTLQLPHEHPVANIVLVNNEILIAGGDGLNNKSVDIYNIISDSWNSTELSNSRFNIAAAVANNKVIFLGGNSSNNVNTNNANSGVFSCNVDVYNANTSTWSLLHLSQEVTGVSATSASGKCGFTGFLYSNGDALTNTVIIIDP